MPKYERPQLPYNAQPLAYNDRFTKVGDANESPSGELLDAEIDYIIDMMNAFHAEFLAATFGIIPGANIPENAEKFPTTDGAGNISWTKLLEKYFSEDCIPEGALKDSCVTKDKLGNGSVDSGKIRQNAVTNDHIEDDKLSFDKIKNENNAHFQQFFNGQNSGTLEGKTIKEASQNGNTIVDKTITGAKLADGTITSLQLSNIIKTPVGTVIDWAGKSDATLPSGWLKANGQIISRTVYADLFNVIGTVYGGGDGSTTFAVPDLRGRSTFGIDGVSTATRIVTPPLQIGGTGGSETHTLTIGQIPAHTHKYEKSITGNLIGSGGGDRTYPPGPEIDTGSAGNGEPHNNMPPYMLIQKLIYAGV